MNDKKITREEFITNVANRGSAFNEHPEYNDDKFILTLAMATFPYAFQDASERLRDDDEIAGLLFGRMDKGSYGHLLEYASDRIKYNPKYVLMYLDEILKNGDYNTDEFSPYYRYIKPLIEIIKEELEIAYAVRGFGDKEDSLKQFQKIKKFNENKNE